MKESFSAVVGVENAGQYRELTAVEVDRSAGRLAVGVLMSEKTGLLGVSNRHGTVYPTFEDTEGIFMEHDEAGVDQLPVVVHYNTDNPKAIGGQLIRALYPYDPEAVQINGLRPQHLRSLATFKEARPGIDVVLQIDSELLSSMRPNELASLFAQHSEVIDFLWLDGSGGEGKPLERAELLPIIEAVTNINESVGVGVAGGLSPGNLEELLTPILEEFPDISWDAQSGVQVVDGYGKKHFDTAAACRFFAASLALREQFA